MAIINPAWRRAATMFEFFSLGSNAARSPILSVAYLILQRGIGEPKNPRRFAATSLRRRWSSTEQKEGQCTRCCRF
jgi:hypothetical protein